MFLDEVIAYGAANGLGTLGTNLFKGIMPPKNPVECCSMLDYPGEGPEYTLGTDGVRFEKPRVQVLYRAATLSLAAAGAYRAFVLLGAVANQTLSGVYYIEIAPVASPAFLKYDANDAPVYVVNFEATREM